MKRRVKLCLAALLVLTMVFCVIGCSQTGGNGDQEEGPTIVVGSKTFTEALLLGDMTYQYLEHLGYPVENQIGLGELAVIRPALESGQVSVYWEYTGTVLINVMEEEPSFDEEECFNTVKEWDAQNGIVWLDYASLNNTYSIMVRGDIAEKYNLVTTTDLIDEIVAGEPIRFVSTQEYNERPDGIQHFENVYGFEFPKGSVISAALNIGYEALKENEAEAGLAFTTDARVAAYDLVMLDDDKNCFPVYNAAPLFKEDILEAYPDIPEQMKELSQLLDDETIMLLNKAVDVDKKSVTEVATEFLEENGLI
ncbi:MAG TPA: glycine betaine ABC transporter substrate-binding protein [Clostridia bacterium]|nr:glycine betaine ABC transporter substrate-binding protein [Clostridia bacterium]